MASLRCLEGAGRMWLRSSGFQSNKTVTERHEEMYSLRLKIHIIKQSKPHFKCLTKKVPSGAVTNSIFNVDIVHDPSRLCCMYTGRRGE